MKTNSLPDGRQRSLCTPIAALAAMAEPAAGSEQHVREPGSGRSQVGALKRCSVLIPKISRMLEATLEICGFFLVILCPAVVLLQFVTFTAPPTWSRRPRISDPRDPTHLHQLLNTCCNYYH